MKATEANLLAFLNPARQFMIPIYQRTYNWQKKHCEELWKDIVRVGEEDGQDTHFFGAIVYSHEGPFVASSVQQLQVIDGQQRLTTVLLLIKALSVIVESSISNGADDQGVDAGDFSPAMLRDLYLFNTHQKKPLKYKLALTKSDKETFESIMEDAELPQPHSVRLFENYRFFLDAIRKADAQVVMRGLRGLNFVDVSLDDRDNPQLIFESLNSTGLDLTQSDLIRNFVLMGQPRDQQERLYETYWHPMEKLFGLDQPSLVDGYIRDYLTLATRDIPRKDQVYEAFKTYFVDDSLTIERVLSDLYDSAKPYTRMTLLQEPDAELLRRFRDISELGVDVAYPFLLGVYQDLEAEIITKEEFLRVLEMVESYVFRRAVVDIPTNSLNSTFATLYGSIDKENYVESLAITFYRMTGARLFPDDEEFIQALVQRNVYRFKRRSYLLRKLENHLHKEPINMDDYTVEHVMPQNAARSATWKKELGPGWEHTFETYLHTLGNLTLTGYNSELGDRAFEEKKTMVGGFNGSHLRLNQTVARADRWNEESIRGRAEELAQLAIQVWPALDVPQDVVKRDAASRRYDPEAEQGNEETDGEALTERLVARVLEALPEISVDQRKVVTHFSWEPEYDWNKRFASIVTFQNGLTLTLAILMSEIDDPLRMCSTRREERTWGVGSVECVFRDFSSLDYAVSLIRQAHEWSRQSVGVE